MLWEARPSARARALLGGFSEAGVSESDDDDDDEEDVLRGGASREDEDAVELAAESAGPERWDVLGLGQAMVSASCPSSFCACYNNFLLAKEAIGKKLRAYAAKFY